MQPLDLALLSLLTLRPMTGYQLKKELDINIGHFWSTTQSHIYKALRGLETDGAVHLQIVPQAGKPDRNVYSITAQGRSELVAWLQQPLQCEPVRESWLIQLFFARILSDEEIRQLFEDRIQQLEQRFIHCVHLQEIRPEQIAGQPMDERAQALIDLTYEYGQAYYLFQKEWQEKALRILDQLPGEAAK
ncbi:MAG: PadR family transcriptional regulator [Anaerolineae bacterium]|jgi:DNA-binding PadR family transcriptional regulator|nr:PadR family transcriptional regulator [Anaerolineae bacterium]